ncbi:MAG: NAD(P)-dependent oxidoreductase [Rhodospirillaceae bacterium]|nr:NAD(P)-dependent oxidoreductase [Rhodospirillaceae bacterium]MYB12723.1 NAD(P)-dependent oxidoreductase [Rhodospirillaceae bacterium]MYI49462.1 NAD(P)-dependent oxidoreductase [Rhodospirillaceae bacterium]
MTARIGIIGYGEAGRAFGAGLAGAGATVATYDILVPTPDGAAIRANAAADGVAVCTTAGDAIDGAAIVLSLVPADAARAVAAEAASHLRSGQLFMDMNSVSPREKETGAALVEASGARYVEATIMAPVIENGVASEVLLAGPAAPEALHLLRPFGMVLAVVGDRFGAAAAVKLCRSVIVKGIEAIMVESMLAARQYGADAAVLASLQKSDPEIDWAARADYVFERVLRHGRRRAAEMRFAGEAVSDAGYPPRLSMAIAELQDAMADHAAADRALFALADYREAADRIGALLAKNEGKARAVSR